MLFYSSAGLPIRKKLKTTAVPSVRLPGKKLANSKPDSRDERLTRRKQKEKIRNLTEDNRHTDCIPSPSPTLSAQQSPEKNIENKYKKLLENYNNLKKDYEQSKLTNKKKLKLMNDRVKYYKKKSDRNINYKQEHKKTQISIDLLQKVFTKNQISIICNKKKWVKWNQEEMSMAFTLRYYSKKCYLYLRNKLHYRLPGLSSLR